jgi:hypothetical protein
LSLRDDESGVPIRCAERGSLISLRPDLVARTFCDLEQKPLP